MSKGIDDTSSVKPRAIIHKQILDVAKERPDATMKQLSQEVSGANVSLVKRVLEEYEDPAVNEEDPAVDEENPAVDEENPAVNKAGDDSERDGRNDGVKPNQINSGPDDGPASDYSKDSRAMDPSDLQLSAIQRETLEAIRNHPEATQREVAEILDVSQSTVNNRLSGINRFEWSSRQSFVTQHLDEKGVDPKKTGSTGSTDPENATEEPDQQPADQSLKEIEERLRTIERHLMEASVSSKMALDDPILIHKAIQACVHADTISEEEERRIIRCLLESE